MTGHFSIEFLIWLLIIASGVAVIAMRLRIPYTVALVLGGLALGSFNSPIFDWFYAGPRPDWLTSEVILFFFLPALLFEGSIKINLKRLRQNLTPILILANVGTLVATLVTGYVLHWAIGLPILTALLFGAAISATDPISVLSIFKDMAVPKRLALLVEAESLLNDGTAAVLFQIFVVALMTREVRIMAGVGQFLLEVIGGGAVGFALSYVVKAITSRIDDPQIEITLTTILAYGSYLIASHLHLSGVIATVVAGISVGNVAAKTGMSARTRLALWSFWEYASFIINYIVFLLIGLEVRVSDMIRYWPEILMAVAAVLLGRIVCVYGTVPLANRFAEKISMGWRHVLVWGGLHGSLSLALVLSLDLNFPERSRILVLTFGVVAFSIIVQGLTIKPLIRLLKISGPQEDAYAVARVEQIAISDARAELEDLLKTNAVSRIVYEVLRRNLEDRLHKVDAGLSEIFSKDSARKEAEMVTARMRLLAAERSSIEHAVHEGLITAEAAAKIMDSTNQELDKLREES
ncbi:MAG: Na+/H+ antiporter [Candidatus Acidiferrales bacterium]